MATPRYREREMIDVDDDRFRHRYTESELRMASEFMDDCLPFLSRDLCRHCSTALSHRFRFLFSESCTEEPYKPRTHRKFSPRNHDDDYSSDSWNDKTRRYKEDRSRDGPNFDDFSSYSVKSFRGRNSVDDMVDEERLNMVLRRKDELLKDERDYARFMNVERKKDFVCFERVDGKHVNILQGLELHTGVFSVSEQKNIVDYIFELQEKGRRGKLRERTYSAPRKWMRGKGRETIQFGCCYNYATDKKGNPPGILRDEVVDPIPPLFKSIIKRLVEWRVLPPSCVPDSCIVNIYEEEDCIPPHIDNHDFLRPFCTVSFLSECNIVLGTELKILGPGEFTGAYKIPLPVGSVLVMKGNGADVAKHCVPAVRNKRISITFRTMDETKQPNRYKQDPDLQAFRPLSYNHESSKNSAPLGYTNLQRTRRRVRSDDNDLRDPRYPSKKQRGPSSNRMR